MSDTTAAPVQVKESVKNDAVVQTFRVVLLGTFAAGADHFIKSEAALVPVLAAGACLVGFAATYAAGLWKLIATHRKLKFLANLLPDSVAQVSP